MIKQLHVRMIIVVKLELGAQEATDISSINRETSTAGVPHTSGLLGVAVEGACKPDLHSVPAYCCTVVCSTIPHHLQTISSWLASQSDR